MVTSEKGATDITHSKTIPYSGDTKEYDGSQEHYNLIKGNL